MSLLDEILEDGKATEATLQRLVGFFGGAGGEIIHEVLKKLEAALQPAAPATPEPPAEEPPAAPVVPTE